ncbi:cyanobacterial protein, TIGR03792 family [Leptolyngbya sp. 'hensonii']|uniref:TIGR03792 family protein n=1 Tax=Leptolyngbya sp. 'hensonii' TaxID=1922337 RepID=UPI00094F5E08|nr:TIGR03792 family protein [Leptolyngbya sp. 'hensonii']OLP18928.1 cyanobacterial protein, TIGR03792 family [Leptolyngbya sp. 'hensonii']
MVIEWLRIQVPPEEREQYIQADAEIWTPFLAAQPGFLNKEVWIAPDRPDQVMMVIRWASMDLWQSIPREQLQAIDLRFTAALGRTYDIVESIAYQVRKFS